MSQTYTRALYIIWPTYVPTPVGDSHNGPKILGNQGLFRLCAQQFSNYLIFSFPQCTMTWVMVLDLLWKKWIISIHICHRVTDSFLMRHSCFCQWIPDLRSGSSLEICKRLNATVKCFLLRQVFLPFPWLYKLSIMLVGCSSTLLLGTLCSLKVILFWMLLNFATHYKYCPQLPSVVKCLSSPLLSGSPFLQHNLCYHPRALETIHQDSQ